MIDPAWARAFVAALSVAGLVASVPTAGMHANQPAPTVRAPRTAAERRLARAARSSLQAPTADTIRAAEVALYIAAHAGDAGLCRRAVARALGLSESKIAHVLATQTRRTFTEHVTFARVRTAQRLLRCEASPVKAIAFKAGFRSPGALTQAFRRHLGLSPARWRNSDGTAT